MVSIALLLRNSPRIYLIRAPDSRRFITVGLGVSESRDLPRNTNCQFVGLIGVSDFTRTLGTGARLDAADRPHG